MGDYDSKQFEDASDWGSRFPEDAVGYQELKGVPFSPEGNLEAWRSVSRLQVAKSASSLLRLFVSHRQSDRVWGMRGAYLATQKGFNFWIDVLDPTLQGSAYQNLPPQQKALVTAVVIEVAILNCSHVLALLTPNMPGSLWVPYEYGRVKADVMFSIQAGCWNHPQALASSGADYLELGVSTYSEQQISTWLASEFTVASGTSPSPRPWPHGRTTPLP
jgi:hypothetical protein